MRCSPCPSVDHTASSHAATRLEQGSRDGRNCALQKVGDHVRRTILHSRQPVIVMHSDPASHPAHRSGIGYLGPLGHPARRVGADSAIVSNTNSNLCLYVGDYLSSPAAVHRPRCVPSVPGDGIVPPRASWPSRAHAAYPRHGWHRGRSPASRSKKGRAIPIAAGVMVEKGAMALADPVTGLCRRWPVDAARATPPYRGPCPRSTEVARAAQPLGPERPPRPAAPASPTGAPGRDGSQVPYRKLCCTRVSEARHLAELRQNASKPRSRRGLCADRRADMAR